MSCLQEMFGMCYSIRSVIPEKHIQTSCADSCAFARRMLELAASRIDKYCTSRLERDVNLFLFSFQLALLLLYRSNQLGIPITVIFTI